LKGDKNVVLEAVRGNGHALEFASHAMRDDEDVVMAASSQCREAVKYASARINRNTIQKLWVKK
jgi:hypothetical protein